MKKKLRDLTGWLQRSLESESPYVHDIALIIILGGSMLLLTAIVSGLLATAGALMSLGGAWRVTAYVVVIPLTILALGALFYLLGLRFWIDLIRPAWRWISTRVTRDP